MTFNLIIVSIVILLGIAFLLAEIFLIPGLSVAGIAGLVFLISGIAYAYVYIGAMVGNISLIVSIFLLLASFLYFIQSKSLRRISLETNIDAKVDTSDLHKIEVGDEGVTESRLNPIGKVTIKGITVEAKSLTGELIDEDTEVVVKKVDWANVVVAKKGTLEEMPLL